MIALGLLIPLAIFGGLVAGIAALARRNDAEPSDGLTRRLVMAALTFGLTIVAAVGVALLIDAAIGSDDGFARSGSGDVAQGLAMVLVGVPAALVLWRYQLRTLAGPDGRSITWLLHAALGYGVFGIGTVVSLGNGLQFQDIDSNSWSSLVFGLTWLGVWAFYEYATRLRPVPVLPGLPRAIGAAIGLVTFTFGGVSLLDALVGQVLDTEVMAASSRFDDIASAVIWTVLGGAVWAWQFLTDRETDEYSRAGLVLGFGVGGGVIMALGGLTGLLAVLLGSITDTFDSRDVSGMVGLIAVGFLVWRFHHGLVIDERGRRIRRHIVAGLSLIATAVGIGVLVNAGLAAVNPAFASTNEWDLLWGGLAAVLVNGPVWWLAWRPDRAPDPDSGTTVQRTYLTLLGGAAAVTGAIALIVLLYQLLEGLLEGESLSTIVDKIRTPLGFVAATAAITAYHYRQWAASRLADDAAPAAVTVERVTFVGSDDTLAESLRTDLGVRETRWHSGGEGRVVTGEELASHLRTLDATDVLVVEEERGYRVIRLLRNGQRPQTGEPQE